MKRAFIFSVIVVAALFLFAGSSTSAEGPKSNYTASGTYVLNALDPESLRRFYVDIGYKIVNVTVTEDLLVMKDTQCQIRGNMAWLGFFYNKQYFIADVCMTGSVPNPEVAEGHCAKVGLTLLLRDGEKKIIICGADVGSKTGA